MMNPIALFVSFMAFSTLVLAADEANIDLDANAKMTIELKANTKVKISCKGLSYSMRADGNGRYDVVDQNGNKILFGVSYEVAKQEMKDLNGLTDK